jgi:hypothetical protein
MLSKEELEGYPSLSKAEFTTFRSFRPHYSDDDWGNCFYCWPYVCSAPPDSGGNVFWKFLSSQLMFYRICATFGMPPPRPIVRGKMAWIVQLIDKHGLTMLRIQDFEGTCLAWYSGFSEDSYKALELLNWLASPEWARPKALLSQTSSEH